jgi:uroporphyrinogen-III decarboxylase
MMNSRERLLRVLDHKDVDRVPIWCMFPYVEQWRKGSAWADVYNTESYRDLAYYIKSHTDFIERDAVPLPVLFNHPDIRYEKENYSGRDGQRILEKIKYRDIEFVRETTVRRDGQRSFQNLIKDIDQLSLLLELPYQAPDIDMLWYRKRRETLGDSGIYCPVFEDAFSIFCAICNESDAAIWAFTDTDKIKTLLDVIQPRIEAILSQFLNEDFADSFFLTGTEYLCEPLASREIFQQLSTPYNQRMTGLIREHNKKSIIHCHGMLKAILPELLLISPDVLQPVEPPPFGDITLAQAREFFGEDMVLVGNIEYTELTQSSPERIEMLVKEAIDEGGPENFILCPSCSPYEDSITPKTAQNYRVMVDAGLKYGNKK